MENFILEVIGFNVKGCVAAQAGGAGRIELCSSPGEGGATPSYAFIKKARAILNIPFYVMIRPRGGDFLFSEEEFDIMKEDIRICKELGADGVVIGMLDEQGNVDVPRCTKLVELAYPLGATFHRAFDRVADYGKALEDVISIGCERILTSGLHPGCVEGLDIIKGLVERSMGRISIMPGSGVRADNIADIIRQAGVNEIHSSASVTYNSEMKYQNPRFPSVPTYVGADEQLVKEMVAEIKKLK